MALQNFESTLQVKPRINRLPEAPSHTESELRAMALGIQAWFDGSPDLNVYASQPRERQKSKPTRKKRSK